MYVLEIEKQQASVVATVRRSATLHRLSAYTSLYPCTKRTVRTSNTCFQASRESYIHQRCILKRYYIPGNDEDK